MAQSKKINAFVFRLQKAFFTSKLFGMCDFNYNHKERKFKQCDVLAIFSCLMAIVWTFTLALAVYDINLMLESMVIKQYFLYDMQRAVIVILNISQQGMGIVLLVFNHINNTALHLRIANEILKCNRRLKSLTKWTLLSSRRFHRFTVLRIIVTAWDIYLIYNRPVYNFVEFEYLVIAHRIIMTIVSFEWSFIQANLAGTMEAMAEFIQTKGRNLIAEDYQKLSNLYTRLLHLHQASCRYYHPFGVAVCTNLFRITAMAYFGLSSLFLSKIKFPALDTGFYLFIRILIPGLTAMLDYAMIGVMSGILSKSAERIRRVLLREVLKTKADESVQQTVDTTLKQSRCKQMSWVLFPGCEISPKSVLSMLHMWVRLGIALVVYNKGGYDIIRDMTNETKDWGRRWYYTVCTIFVIVCLACDKIVEIYASLVI